MTALALRDDQAQWDDRQLAALRSAGIEEDVSEGELTAFLHECQTRKLDPFTKQIYLIGRFDKRARRKVYRSQTGIDGFRLVARRAAEMAHKVSLEVSGVIENMAGFVTPDGERYAIFGEGGGQALADELDVPLLGRVPLTMPLRAASDAGVPLVVEDPDDPAAQAIRHAARGLIALAPPPRPRATQAVGMALPMAG